jgi:hypothetical protein
MSLRSASARRCITPPRHPISPPENRRRRAGGMAQTVCVIVSASDRRRLAALVGDRRRQRKHVERARIVLASAGCPPVQQVAEAVGVSRPMVWRWQQRFAEAGVEGLLMHDTKAII